LIPRSWTKNGWDRWHLAMAIVSVALAILVTLDAWRDIVWLAVKDIQGSQESSHVFMVPVVAAWLVWVRWGRFRNCKPRGTAIGPILMLIGWAAYSLGDSYFVQVAWHGGAVILAIGAFFSIFGSQVLFAFLPAVLVLAFMIPVPGSIRSRIAIPLERVTTKVTQEVCETVGMDVERSGNVLTINHRQVEIAEACNGLRMVFALTLVSFAVGFGTPLRWYVRLLIVAGSPISAIVCNVIRLVPTVWMYGNASQKSASFFHDISGWLMLPIAFLLLMGIVKLLQWALVPVTTFTLAYD